MTEIKAVVGGPTAGKPGRYQITVDAVVRAVIQRDFGSGVKSRFMTGGLHDIQVLTPEYLKVAMDAAIGKSVVVTLRAKPYNFVDKKSGQRRTGTNLEATDVRVVAEA